ncbi:MULTISPECIES: hypothetical protein [unclassified Bradyrhizobium]|uniref:hypothetical protein n=1 Tax=unclassified Bradyrhizobium TaxID=2631580 RepID=UPI001FF874A9|nr:MULTISPECIES: hypothetical protein [unclassified Bradyrhizobium]
MARDRYFGRMLLQLTRSVRMKVGWLVALAYLFCVVAPAAALALGTAAPCLTDDAVLADLVPAHRQTSHIHAGNTAHDHAKSHGHDHAAAQDAPAQHHHDGKGKPGPCCGTMCMTALPADLPDIAKPVQPISTCAPEIAIRVHSEAPPLLYRPPIV